ncbi:MAG: hypothetical protein K0R49_1720 [Burkholderiales bacterium]|jgi:hypothetical protein|nr:hypothetical protein [Burkholderiales bacterium]
MSNIMINQKTIIKVQGAEITVLSYDKNDFICLSDITKGFDGGLAQI